jgi:serpin B
MQLFIPDQPTGLPDFLNSLTTEKWTQWQAAFSTSREVDLTLPRFQLDWEQDLSTALCAMGLGPALGPDANFTPMGFSSEVPGSIGQIIHKTYLSVDEKGTEAAGVTAIYMVMGGFYPTPPRRVVVRADRPFFCAIVDNETGTILFSGAVYQPGT